MKLLEERIRKDGVVKEGQVLKVDAFLNHQMDVELFNEMGKEFKRLFAEKEINKIQSMVELYNKNQTVYCRISTINNDILGIPVKLSNNILTIKTSESLLLDVELSKIKSVEIIHF